MRYGPEHKLESRRKILQASSRAIKANGPQGVSVAAVMSEAGLTHGAFYAHFTSKDDLVAASITQMFEDSQQRLRRVTSGKPPAMALRDYIDSYLSARHCAAVAEGCPIVALGGETPRLDAAARAAFARGLAARQALLVELLEAAGTPQPQDTAQSVGSELLGALLTARLVQGGEREQVLESSRAALKRRLGLQ